MNVAKSPLSDALPNKIRDLSRDFIVKELEAYYGVKPPPNAVEIDYSMWKCSETGIEFAWPMLPGNACFYEWLSGFASYYPGYAPPSSALGRTLAVFGYIQYGPHKKKPNKLKHYANILKNISLFTRLYLNQVKRTRSVFAADIIRVELQMP